jgi:ribosomal protein L39E
MSNSNLAYKKQSLTDADYLRIERAAFEKSEFIDGRIVAMAGASENHNVISSNTFLEIGIQTKKTDCRAFSSDMRVKAKKGNYYYPDIVVVCGERKFEDNKKRRSAQSESRHRSAFKINQTQRPQRKIRFLYCARRFDRLRSHRTRRNARRTFYKNQRKRMELRGLTENADKLVLDSINCEISSSEIYREVKF